MKSQVERAKKRAAREAADDDEDFDDNSDSSRRQTQNVASDSEDEVPTQRGARVKPEASRRPAASEFEEMDED